MFQPSYLTLYQTKKPEFEARINRAYIQTWSMGKGEDARLVFRLGFLFLKYITLAITHTGFLTLTVT